MAWLDIFTGVDSEQTQADLDQSDAKLAALEKDYQERHREQLGQAGIDQRNAEFQAHQRDSHIESVEDEVNQAFDEGLDEGAADIRNTIGSAVDKVVLTPLKIIPWEIWAVVFIAAAIYFASTFGFLKKLNPA